MSTYPTLSLKNKNPAIVSASVVVPMTQPKPQAKPSKNGVEAPKEKGSDHTPPTNPEKVFWNSLKGKPAVFQTVLGEEIIGTLEGDTKYNLIVSVDGISRCVMKHRSDSGLPSCPGEMIVEMTRRDKRTRC